MYYNYWILNRSASEIFVYMLVMRYEFFTEFPGPVALTPNFIFRWSPQARIQKSGGGDCQASAASPPPPKKIHEM